MKCKELKKLIPEFLGGDLNSSQANDFRKHMKSCRACQLEVRAYESSWEMLDSWQDIEPHPDYVFRFWNRLVSHKPWHEELLAGLRQALTNRQLVPVYAAVCTLLIVGAFTLKTTVEVRNPDEVLAVLPSDELDMVANLDLAQNYDIISDLDFLEDMEIIENLDA